MADDPTEKLTPDAEAEAPAATATPKTKLGWGIGALITVATIVTLLAFISIWANRQVLNTDQWTDTSTALLEKPAVRDALANYLVDQLFANIDVQAELQQDLPPALSGLAGPIAGGMRQLALKGAETALEKPLVQAAWKDANRTAHQHLLTILSGGSDEISTANGVVTLNTKLLLSNVAKQVGVPTKLVDKLPPQVGALTVMRSDELKTAQNASKAIKGMAIIFSILALVLYIAAIWLAAGRRRKAVRWTGISFALVGLMMLLIQSFARTPVVDSLASTSAVVPAVTDVYNVSTDLLKQMAVSTFVSGLLVIVASILGGPSKIAVGFRREVAPYLKSYLPAAAAFAFLLFLLLVWWAPTHGFRTTGGLLLNALLAVSGFVALTVMTRREFPDAEAPDFAKSGDWMRGRWDASRDFYSRQSSKVGGGDSLAEIERLQKLRDSGALTDEEFAAQKKKLLGE
ncbi:MAG: SHOCT domain-containing protein [Solirubrobacterales bacterium]